ncbi:MAG: bifunctional molybdenum cofactor biosynthesis protein MoaC/MoaB [Cytophagaceae bacterium]|jgi:molybdenum cofactor biosynthesis protein MoaC|nr:bifunctional molybdenum cofactor biosynthesis protein MoaC/MoaB [Cytophagaceae bacterium]
MVDITHKSTSLRRAVAEATVRMSSEATITAVLDNKVPKGNVLEIARAAGLFAAKRTSDMIPDCHPIPIEYTDIQYTIQRQAIVITVTIATVYKTGVEVEAMHAASVVALTMYDMLKPLDKGIQIETIRLSSKTGGKSSVSYDTLSMNAVVVSCSNAVYKGKREDRAGGGIVQLLQTHGISVSEHLKVEGTMDSIQTVVQQYASTNNVELLVLYGGTGLTTTDVTPEALERVLDKRAHGIEAAILQYGQARTPQAMLSRVMAGMVGDTLVIAIPGSSGGAQEALQALLPQVKHSLIMQKASKRDE